MKERSRPKKRQPPAARQRSRGPVRLPWDGSSSEEEDIQEKPAFRIRRRRVRVFFKNNAVDTTYAIKFYEKWRGRKLYHLNRELRGMFQQIINELRRLLPHDDLGRIVIHHPNLQNPIVVSLRTLDKLTVDAIMGEIERVLNSHEELTLDRGFVIDVGVIQMPRGGRGKGYITNVNEALSKKKSIVEIRNKDNMCMARALVVAWAKHNITTIQEWQGLTTIRNMDPVTKALTFKKVPLWFYRHLKENKRRSQDEFARELCRRARVNPNQPASLNDLTKFEEFLNISVHVVAAHLGNKFLRVPNLADAEVNEQRKNIFLYYVDGENGMGHFHAIVSISGFFSSSYFCTTCLKPYNNAKHHSCETTCKVCTSNSCPVSDDKVTCKTCHMECRSLQCLERHKAVKQSRNPNVPSKSQCEKWWRCTKCKKVLQVAKQNPLDHKCNERYCGTCDSMVEGIHLCHQRAYNAKDSSEFKHLYFDFECRQDDISECPAGYRFDPMKRCRQCQDEETQCGACKHCLNCSDISCGYSQHKANYVVSQKVCNLCQNSAISVPCRNCGDRCIKCNKRDPKNKEYLKPPCNTCGGRQKIFSGDDTSNLFGQYLFNISHKDFTMVAHNMKGYDGYFLLEYLIKNSITPGHVIYSGSKIMYLTVKRGLDIRIIDSLNFLSAPLSAFPKIFGLKELKKGWFPHHFNTKANENYIGPFPGVEAYGVSFMSTNQRQEFLEWHSKQTGIFDFQKEIKEYCISDVTILRETSMAFRSLMIQVTSGSIDPFSSITIASVCMNIYKTKYLTERHDVTLTNAVSGETLKTEGLFKDNKWTFLINDELCSQTDTDWEITNAKFVSSPIAQVPPHGYSIDQYSISSIRWLEWLTYSQGLEIQHALNTGEHRVPNSNYRLDGFIPATETSKMVAIEWHGCVWHGCRKCGQSGKHPYTKQSASELYTLTMKKKHFLISQGYRYICIWECEYNQQVQADPVMKHFVNNLDVQPRLHPRDSFFGGRTNAAKLFYQINEEEQIKYVDFTSLYPWVNKYAEYPVGHPKILTKDFKDIASYFGMAHVKILPPRGLYHPVLPVRSNGKLKFPLCRTCANAENQNVCQCTEEDRSFIGTWCIPEISKAIEKGYKLLTVFEVYHWENTSKYDPNSQSGGLFSEYINAFLKLKQEASGWPAWCVTDEDKRTYVQNYKEREGIQLDPDNIAKNPGLRSLAKLCLNSFWGKFGQRLDITQTKFVDASQANVFFSMLTDPKVNVKDFYIASPNAILLQYTSLHDTMAEDKKTNVFIASFTTCWARLKLYDVLDRLDRRVLYYDTDSIIYVSKPGFYEPNIGDYLGDLTDELDGDYIVTFVSGGPKNYSYETNAGKKVCKVRGFTLNHANSLTINFDVMKDMVNAPEHIDAVHIVNPSKICRDGKRNVLYNRRQSKKYKIVYTKRAIQPDLDTLPYGF